METHVRKGPEDYGLGSVENYATDGGKELRDWDLERGLLCPNSS